LRLAIEDFEATMAGLVLSSYFAGYTLGAVRSGRIIERIGHIRAYAAFAAVVIAATALMPLLVGALPWLVLRAVVGFGCAGLFITTESWLSAKAQPAERGRVFSVYMVGVFLALAMGQLLVVRANIETAAPFNVIVALFAVALVMVTTTRAEPPARAAAPAMLPYGQLTRAAPVAVIGCVLAGLIRGAFYTLVPAWMQDRGIPRMTIALFMLVTVLGGLAFQVPVGRLPTASTDVSCWPCLASALRVSPSLWSSCHAPCRRSCRPRRCSGVLCRPFTRSASPMHTTVCRPTGSWR